MRAPRHLEEVRCCTEGAGREELARSRRTAPPRRRRPGSLRAHIGSERRDAPSHRTVMLHSIEAAALRDMRERVARDTSRFRPRSSPRPRWRRCAQAAVPTSMRTTEAGAAGPLPLPPASDPKDVPAVAVRAGRTRMRPMSLIEILPDVQSLPRADKLRLIQILAQELAEAEAPSELVAVAEV